MSVQTIYMTCGFPGSGKSTYITNNFTNAIILSNDKLPKGVNILKEFNNILLANSSQLVVLDNTHLTKKNRKEFIDIANKFNKKIELLYFNSSLEDCQINVLKRQWQKFGQLFLDSNEMKGISDPHVFPPAALFKARSSFEDPLVAEGFSRVSNILVPSASNTFIEYPNKAIFFDIDGTLRKTEHLPNKYPTKPEEVILLLDKDKMKSKIDSYRKEGYLFFGISNQSGISKGILSEKDCESCMEKTKELLDFSDITIKWCNHRAAPVSCYCRKPQSGLGIYFIEKYKVNPKNSIMVGDSTTDKTFAQRIGMKFIHVDKFWN